MKCGFFFDPIIIIDVRKGGGGGGGGWGWGAVIGFAALGPGFTGPRRRVTKKWFFLMRTTNYLFRKVHNYMHFKG